VQLGLNDTSSEIAHMPLFLPYSELQLTSASDD
jgi:hypothetical protein